MYIYIYVSSRQEKLGAHEFASGVHAHSTPDRETSLLGELFLLHLPDDWTAVWAFRWVGANLVLVQ